jgi:hypothetical protein
MLYNKLTSTPKQDERDRASGTHHNELWLRVTVVAVVILGAGFFVKHTLYAIV